MNQEILSENIAVKYTKKDEMIVSDNDVEILVVGNDFVSHR